MQKALNFFEGLYWLGLSRGRYLREKYFTINKFGQKIISVP